ncbi:MAG: phosphate uptake regulator PhoU [Candidatus Bathyarchaeota archaeon]|nr:phosphate uptake regulator PhoU [Candidatus Bathyarchaeota archaeon]
METRKIVALGSASLVITLPKDWLRVNSLTKGDRVYLEIQRDRSLRVVPFEPGRDVEKRIVVVVEPDQNVESITRIIIGCYLNGYNTIQLTSKKFFTPNQQDAIRDIVRTLYIWIMESQASEIVLSTLINESLMDIQSGIERMHMITNSMCKDVLAAMIDWDYELASSVLSLENDVDQFMFSLHRFIRAAASDPSLASKLDVDTLDCLDYQLLVDKIERVADHVSRIAESIIAMKGHRTDVLDRIWNVLIEAAQLSFNAYEVSVDHYLDKNIESSDTIIDGQRQVKELTMSITPLPRASERDSSTFYALFDIRDQINRISEYAADIAEISIDRAYKPASS